jgi:microcystin-dependent protein
MPNPSGSTPVFGFPYLLETDIPDIATASEVLALAVEAYFEKAQVPIGGVIEWYKSSLPSQGTWLYMEGQVVPVASYPLLAAVYPAWVTGGSITLPDTRDRFTIGAGGSHAAGATGGSATITLGTANIPQFSVGLSISDPGHYHAAQPGFAVVVQTTSSMNLQTAGSGTQVASNVGAPNTDTKTTGISGTVTFGSASPSSVNTTPPYISAYKIVRAG